MADVKISQLPQLLNANANGSDSLPIVDSVAGQTKQIKLSELDQRWQSLPIGGTAGQLLKKNSSAPNDVVWTTLTKSDIGLSNVNNTSDLDKPVSIATQSALNLKANNTALALKADKTYVDAGLASKQDVLPAGTDGYFLSLVLGVPTWVAGGGGGGAVDSVFGRTGVVTAQTGDYTKAQVGLSDVDNTSDLDKPISTATQSALNAKQDLLPAGTDGYVLTLVAGVPTWQPSSSAAPAISGTRAAPVTITVTGISFSGSSYQNLKFIKSGGGLVTVTANPQIQAGTAVGQVLTLIGRDDTDRIKLADGTGLSLNGDWYSFANNILCLIWDGTVWCELYRRA